MINRVEIKEILKKFSTEFLEQYKPKWLKVKIQNKSDLLEIAKEFKKIDFRSISTISATDFIEENKIEMNYFFQNLLNGENIWLKVDIERELEKCEIDSIVNDFKGALWHEKETFSTYGVKFIGHENLDYFLISSDYYGKFPFRKDFDWEAHEKNLIENMNNIQDHFENEYSENSKNLDENESKTILNWGPTHPASGPLRLKVEVDGEDILGVKADIGYVWRALENLVERKTFLESIVAVERICFMDNTNSMICYAQVVEEIGKVEITDFAKMMRVVLGELGRVVSHFMGMGGFFNTMGLHTLGMWLLDIRENFLDALEEYSGARIATASVEAGGVRFPLNLDENNRSDFFALIEQAINKYEDKSEEIKSVFLNNPTMKMRASQTGYISFDEVLDFSLFGIVARGSGVKTDIRIDEPYAGYDKVDVDYMISEEGTAKGRFDVLFKEIDQSMRILKQALANLKDGIKNKTYNPEKDHLVKVPKKLPAGESVSRVEWSRGELMIHLVTQEKSTTPYRLKIKAPSVNHTMMLEELLKGQTLSDIPLVFGSLYICQGDLDR